MMKKNNKKIHILIVEDTAAISKGITLVINRFYNAHVDVASDGVSGLAKATEKRYDLIMLDIGLPEMLGLEVAETVRAFPESQKAQVPIIILTATVNAYNHIEKCKEMGLRLLEKPTETELLKSTIDEIIIKKG